MAAPTPLLFLDEPSSGLDPLMEHVLISTLGKCADEGRTVLLSSHILSEVDQVCSDVTIIKDGLTVEAAPLSELREIANLQVTARLSPTDATAIAAHLEKSGVTATVTKTDPVTLTAEVPHAVLPQLLTDLGQRGIQEVSCIPASLEDLFLCHYSIAEKPESQS